MQGGGLGLRVSGSGLGVQGIRGYREVRLGPIPTSPQARSHD